MSRRPSDKKSTACYRSVQTGRLYFVYTNDPIARRGVLQSQLRQTLRLMCCFVGKILPQIADSFDSSRAEDGSFEPVRELLEYLQGLRRLKYFGETSKYAGKLLSHPDLGRLVRETELDDLPDRCVQRTLVKILHVSDTTFRRWILEGCPVHEVGRDKEIDREELRSWLDGSGRVYRYQ